MERDPGVSIMMPVYNGLPLIKASIRSLLNQTYSNWECIIVDDGSTDGTSHYIDSLEDKRFRIYHFANNQGRPLARQKCLELATGEYLAMLDAEDLYHPQKLEMQVAVLSANPEVALVGSKMCSFGTKTALLRIRGKASPSETHYNDCKTMPCHATCMLRMHLAKKISYNPLLTTGQDVDFLERYLKDRKLIVLDQILYYYSEFNSVTKRKIRKTYYLYIKKYFNSADYFKSFVYSMKYLYAVLFFPFIPIHSILSKRGNIPTATEIEEYEKYCTAVVDKL